MSFKHNNINPELANLFEFENEKDELKHDAQVLMFRFLSEIERIYGGEIKQKELAKAINTSPSFINQLFSGDKLCNLITLAKFQKSFDIIFDVVAVRANQNSVYGYDFSNTTAQVHEGNFANVSKGNPLTFELGGVATFDNTEKIAPQLTATA